MKKLVLTNSGKVEIQEAPLFRQGSKPAWSS